ncbi:hypothetical protein [Streptomyces sp. SAJ15]|uniref:hypothetical protein n=1 Tax=Streptomyces sp. SAJ15 TaxID=2011095 RepID=UPI001184B97F|nr:hypothetical protein [Streptomyces sp. SAJ15]TVL91936.1 hypothetical protein CD790_14755 [Streptomyces sp. SAJ15]
MATDRPPRGLGPAGRRLWREIQSGYELDADECALLVEACRTADELQALHEAIGAGPVVVPGSRGQPKVSPLFAEARAHRLALARLLAELALPGEDQEEGDTPAQARARHAAQVRWALARGAGGGAA